MDYSKLSDFEINCAVARAAGLEDVMFFDVDSSICLGPVWELPSGQYVDYLVAKGCPFAPCSNPADAWPIIVENYIGIAPYPNEAYAWSSRHGMASGLSAECKNPLRAAMIVFLMMQEGKAES